VEAVHLAHRAGLAEPIDVGDEMLVTLRSDILDQIEIELVAVSQIDHQLFQAVFQLMVEGRPPPVFRGVAGFGRTIFEAVALVGFGIGPAETAPLEHGMQRVDEDERARQLDAFGAAALAETADQVVSRQASQALADQPVHQAQAGREFHRRIMPRNRDGRKAGRAAYACAGMTTSPSSFTNVPSGRSSSSSTSSDGRHSRTPFGVTTIGRLIRIGCASMKSISSSSLHFGSARPSSA